MKLRKNKKAMVVLLMSAIAFLIAAVLFSAVGSKIKVGPELDYIGQTQDEIFDYYGYGEEIMFYLDIAAKESSKIVWQDGMAEGQFITLFKPVFNKYLEKFNKKFSGKEFDLSVDNYTISIKDKKLILKTDKLLQIVPSDASPTFKPYIKYKINPSISIILDNKVQVTKVEKPKEVIVPPSTVSLR